MNPIWTVKSVKALENYKLLITFEQNIKKIFDMKPYLQYSMYKPLEDITLFNSVSTNGQTAGMMKLILHQKLFSKTELYTTKIPKSYSKFLYRKLLNILIILLDDLIIESNI